MISHKKACEVVKLEGKKRNAPNLSLSNPRLETRNLTSQDIAKIRNTHKLGYKKDW